MTATTGPVMDEIVEALVLAPFKEVVEKAKAALESAKGGDGPEAERMAKMSNNLARAGDRAVDTIEPRCRKIFETYGHNFVDGLKKNVELSGFRSGLKAFLWEFDDYIDLDSFEEAKFKELQSLVRKSALRIDEILLCMDLEPMAVSPSASAAAAPVAMADDPRNKHGSVDIGDHNSHESRQSICNQDSRRESLTTGLGCEQSTPPQGNNSAGMGSQSGPDLGLEGEGLQHARADGQFPSRNESTCSKASSVPAEPPPFPQGSPWKEGTFEPEPAMNTSSGQTDEAVDYPRRERIPSLTEPTPEPEPQPDLRPRSEETGLHFATEVQDQEAQPPFVYHQTPPPAFAAAFPAHPAMTSPSPGFVNTAHHAQYHQAAFSPPPPPASPSSPTVPINQAATQPAAKAQKPPSSKMARSQMMTYLPLFPGVHGGPEDPSKAHTHTQLRSELQRDAVRRSRANSGGDSHQGGPLADARRDSGYEPVSPGNVSHRASSVMATPDSGSYSPPLAQHPIMASVVPGQGAGFGQQQPTGYPPPQQPPPFANAEAEQPGLELNRTQTVHEFETGLIPVDVERTQELTPPPPSREPDCSIGPSSSFHQLKGFCEGAKEMLRGGEGIKQVRKLNYGTGAVMAAKCKSCLFELEWNEVEADRTGQSSANYISKSSGVGFRLRFLSKSHLPAKTIEDQVYACLFCVQLGRTTEESDATAFFSQKQLFGHIARHQRPLPIVPGINVIETAEIPALFRNNYDVHLQYPPRQSVTNNLAREIDAMPMATAVETVKQTHGTLRLPPDRASPLQFAVGAKIVGVEFPIRYNGEWAIGWSDNSRGVFPADAVRLEPPPRGQMAVQQGAQGGGLRFVVRWKFNNKDKERGDWLKLEKGEVISNVAWAHPGHWCWSGTNSKGKWGIFPQSHIDSNSLREGFGGNGGGGGAMGTVMTGMGPGGDRASIASHEKRRSSIFTRMANRARPGSSSTGSDTPRPSIY